MSENNKNYYSENPAKKKKKEIIIIDDDSNEEMNNENKEEEEIINLSKNDNDNIQTPSFTELTKKIKKKKSIFQQNTNPFYNFIKKGQQFPAPNKLLKCI